MRQRGRLIVIEGADGVGTTTQSARLAEALRAMGRQVHTTCEPSTGPIGVLIRTLLRGEAPCDRHALALLFAADRLHHVAHEIEPRLNAGVDVITDRYVLSSLVYQSIDVPLPFVRTMNASAMRPDVTVLLQLPLATAMARVAARGAQDIFEDDSTQRAVHARYDELASEVEARVVDASGTVEDVTNRIMRVVQPLLSMAQP